MLFGTSMQKWGCYFLYSGINLILLYSLIFNFWCMVIAAQSNSWRRPWDWIWSWRVVLSMSTMAWSLSILWLLYSICLDSIQLVTNKSQTKSIHLCWASMLFAEDGWILAMFCPITINSLVQGFLADLLNLELDNLVCSIKRGINWFTCWAIQTHWNCLSWIVGAEEETWTRWKDNWSCSSSVCVFLDWSASWLAGVDGNMHWATSPVQCNNLEEDSCTLGMMHIRFFTLGSLLLGMTLLHLGCGMASER